MSPARVLVAGIGNIFFGDDGFGVAVAQSVGAAPTAARRGRDGHRHPWLDLTYALMDGYEAAILIDTVQRGGPPGTLYVIEPTVSATEAAASEPSLLDAHGMEPARVLAFVRASGAALRTLRLVGCEPTSLCDPDEPQVGLSEPVAGAVERASVLVESLLAECCHA